MTIPEWFLHSEITLIQHAHLFCASSFLKPLDSESAIHDFSIKFL